MLSPARMNSGLFVFCLAFLLVAADGAAAEKGTHRFPLPEGPRDGAYLIDQLVLDGFDRAYLVSLFADPRAQFLPDVILINLINKYVATDYSGFVSPRSVRNAKQFLARESAFLRKVEQRFAVDKEVIVSILSIESAFGNMTGSTIVFNVFSTLSLASRPEIRKVIAEHIAAYYPHIPPEDIEKRTRKKSAWAYRELKAVLTLARQESIDVLQIKGSWAGAFGIAQFLPSSYLKFALDGNNDRKVRLHNRYDAMVSVANYLKEHGWSMDLPDLEKKLVLRKYNNSGAYTDTVLQLSRMIRGQR